VATNRAFRGGQENRQYRRNTPSKYRFRFADHCVRSIGPATLANQWRDAQRVGRLITHGEHVVWRKVANRTRSIVIVLSDGPDGAM
jgi:hypothetical protein